MKPLRSIFVILIGSLIGALPFTASGAEGVVLNERVNVRTRPSLSSEVIQQLNTGNKVTILERVTLNDPQPNEPVRWFRIQIPDNTTLWVSSEYIDPVTNTVMASRLNVRAGPGENFSVVGRIERNTVVDPIRVNAGWTAIKPLKETVAYVAATFIRESSTTSASEILEPLDPLESPEPEPPKQAPVAEITQTGPIPELIIDEEDAPPPVPSATTPVSKPSSRTEPSATTVRAPIAQPVREPIAATLPEESLFDRIESVNLTPAPLMEAAPVATPPVQDFSPITSMSASEPGDLFPPTTSTVETLPEPTVDALRRVITRDGIVRRARNIQAPTYHRLDDPRTGTTINYLYTGKLQIDLGTGPKALKPYEGRKIRVIGPESVDARWPRIPVIEVEQLRILE